MTRNKTGEIMGVNYGPFRKDVSHICDWVAACFLLMCGAITVDLTNGRPPRSLASHPGVGSADGQRTWKADIIQLAGHQWRKGLSHFCSNAVGIHLRWDCGGEPDGGRRIGVDDGEWDEMMAAAISHWACSEKWLCPPSQSQPVALSTCLTASIFPGCRNGKFYKFKQVALKQIILLCNMI